MDELLCLVVPMPRSDQSFGRHDGRVDLGGIEGFPASPELYGRHCILGDDSLEVHSPEVHSGIRVSAIRV